MSFIVSKNWLNEWISLDKIDSVTDTLTSLGLEVESITPVASPLKKIVVGQVMAVEAHPDADRLRVCQVNVSAEEKGEGSETNERLTIVCGAKNVTAGKKYPVALIGAVLPNGCAIKKARLRGVESQGMLCSSEELGLAELGEAGGILTLSDNAPVGALVEDYLGLVDNSIELSITPNRGDCLSILGVARELSAASDQPIKKPEFFTTGTQKYATVVSSPTPTTLPLPNVTLKTPESCWRYVGCAIKNIDTKATSPDWLKERLRRSGLRSRSPVVDVTNYVMLALGQPMHAFDLAKIDGDISVRYARSGEVLPLINGQTVTLDKRTQIISDAKKPLAIAGVMGGEYSAVGNDTQHIFLESACFSPLSVTHPVRHHNITSDSAYRFERGVDPNLSQPALAYAIELLRSIVGGEVGPVIERVSDTLSSPVPITLRACYLQRVLGKAWPETTVESVLRRLNMSFKKVEQGWEVNPPSYRFDITQEIDLVEEVIRLIGYQQLRGSMPVATANTDSVASECQLREQRLAEFMVDRGYHQVITYSFVDEKKQQLVDPDATPLFLANPMSESMNVMRTTLLPGLLEALKYNYNRQQDRIRLFEIGQCFTSDAIAASVISPSDTDAAGKLCCVKPTHWLGAIAHGYITPDQWSTPKRLIDFFDSKGDLESLLSLNHCGDTLRIIAPASAAHPSLHPGESAHIQCEKTGNTVGYIGGIHPSILEQFELKAPVYFFTINLDAIEQGRVPRVKPLSKYPTLCRDVAVIIKKTISYDKLLKTIDKEGGDLLKNVQLFDLYERDMEVGYHSLALRLLFQDQQRTLTEEEVAQCMDNLLKALKKKWGVLVR